MNYRRLQRKISISARKFLNGFLRGFDPPRQRLVRDPFCGMRRCGSMVLSEIGRCIRDSTALQYTEKRFSRELGDPHSEVAAEKLCRRFWIRPNDCPRRLRFGCSRFSWRSKEYPGSRGELLGGEHERIGQLVSPTRA